MSYARKPKPNYGYGRQVQPPKEIGELGGKCRSCKKKQGRYRHIPGHAGIPVLCDDCVDLRKERVAINRYLFYLIVSMEKAA